jgi:hypothetical protein
MGVPSLQESALSPGKPTNSTIPPEKCPRERRTAGTMGIPIADRFEAGAANHAGGKNDPPGNDGGDTSHQILC